MAHLLVAVMARRYPSGSCPRPLPVRLIFWLYLAVIASGLAFYIVIGLTHH
jgi:hypothetical protein